MRTNKDNIVKKNNRIRNSHHAKKKKIVRKINCIIDTDPGVDDSAAIVLSFIDDLMDIKLITTVSGNLDIDAVTRNALHLVEKFGQNIPVAKGSEKPLVRNAKDAKFIHQHEGMGGYIPPKEVGIKPIDEDAIDAMYEVIKKYKNDICLIALGPHTNLGRLIMKYPDVIGMINHIYSEGCSPYGWKTEGRWKDYVSFNASSDPEALKIVVESGIPMTMVPSRMGRELANFMEKDIIKMRDINDVGRFLAEMYFGYWEYGYTDRRIATNDTCACLSMRFPELFKTKKVAFKVNVDDLPGRTDITPDKHGHINLVYKVNRKKLKKLYFKAVDKMNNFKLYND